MSERRRATSADVARLAGVSRATVSFVLNDKPGQTISAATREAVLAAAEELGYMPSPHATALRSGRSRLVLVLVPRWASGPLVMRYLELTARELSAHGLLTVTYIETAAPLKDLLAVLHPAAVMSLVPLPAEDSALLARAGIAEVHGYIADFPGRLESITLNQQRMGEAQARHLIERGYRRIVHVSGPEVGHPLRAAGRVDGARTVAAGEPGVSFDVLAFDTEEALDALVRTWARLPERLGICAFDDATALEVLAALRRGGVAVPGQVGIVGVDDIRAGRFSEPPLSTVHPDLEHQARAVTRAALDALGLPRGAGELDTDAQAATTTLHRGTT